MCGLFSVIPKNTTDINIKAANKILLELFLVSQTRGSEGVGLFYPNKEGITVYKNPIMPAMMEYVLDEYAIGSESLGKHQFIVGHTRRATNKTKMGYENTHPFTNNHITLVHNGYVNNLFPISEVDSKLIAEELGEVNSIEEYKEKIERFRGAYALFWWDNLTRSLYIARNAERTLYYMEAKNFIIFASEERMLDFVSENFLFSGHTYSVKEYPVGLITRWEEKTKGGYKKVEELKFTEKPEIISTKYPYKGYTYGVIADLEIVHNKNDIFVRNKYNTMIKVLGLSQKGKQNIKKFKITARESGLYPLHRYSKKEGINYKELNWYYNGAFIVDVNSFENKDKKLITHNTQEDKKIVKPGDKIYRNRKGNIISRGAFLDEIKNTNCCLCGDPINEDCADSAFGADFMWSVRTGEAICLSCLLQTNDLFNIEEDDLVDPIEEIA